MSSKIENYLGFPAGLSGGDLTRRAVAQARSEVAELDPEQFWQTHRSTIVNAMQIAGIEPNMAGQLGLRLKNRREQLPVAESFMRRFRQM